MSRIQATRRELCRLLLSPSRPLQISGEPRSLVTLSHASVCRHTTGSCILCKEPVIGHTVRFGSTDSSEASKDHQKSTSSGSTGKKESDSAGTEGGMLGERSGPSKEAVPSDKQAQEDNVEEAHVNDSKQPETAPWAS